MDWSQLSRVAFMFPDDDLEAQAFFTQLEQLLGQDPSSTINEDLILLSPVHPPSALPITSLELASGLPIPKLVLETDLPFELRIGNFFIHSSDVVADMPYQPQPPPKDRHTLLPMLDFVQRFEGHILRLDHTGLNVPAALLEPPAWQSLLHDLAGISALYRYPTGAPWYFLLPATPEELQDGIRTFVYGRDPKFELVYDTGASRPTVQFQLDTDLTRRQVEELLPRPYGKVYKGLEGAFRAVYVEHPWPDLWIRFDLAFQHEPAGPDIWSNSEWLVREGKRVERSGEAV